jgi:hypothetical protein
VIKGGKKENGKSVRQNPTSPPDPRKAAEMGKPMHATNSIQGNKNRSNFSKFGENWRNRVGPNSKTAELLFTVSKFQKKIKVSKKYKKKLDQILRLLVKKNL